MGVSVDIGILDGDWPQVRMRDELDIRNHAYADAFLDREPDRLSTTNFHHDIDANASIGQRLLEGEARGSSQFHAAPPVGPEILRR